MTPQTTQQAISNPRAPVGTSSMVAHWQGAQVVSQLSDVGASPSSAETLVLLAAMVVLRAITVRRRT